MKEMNRRNFLQRIAVGTAAMIAMPVVLAKDDIILEGTIPDTNLNYEVTKSTQSWENHIKGLRDWTIDPEFITDYNRVYGEINYELLLGKNPLF